MQELEEVILRHLRTHPGFCLQDLYKLLHQASFGPSHLQFEEIRKDLFHEIEKLMEKGRGEELFEEIDPLRTYIRVNLRPFLFQGGKPEKLVSLIFSSIEKKSTGRIRLRRLIGIFLSREELMRRFGDPKSIKAFFELMESKGLPPVPHSPLYAKMNRPSYRVIRRVYLSSLF